MNSHVSSINPGGNTLLPSYHNHGDESTDLFCSKVRTVS